MGTAVKRKETTAACVWWGSKETGLGTWKLSCKLLSAYGPCPGGLILVSVHRHFIVVRPAKRHLGGRRRIEAMET